MRIEGDALLRASIGGNTSGTLALISTGTLLLAGGNNITLSQDGNTVSISGGAGAGGSFSAGLSTLGNTSGTSGTVSGFYIFAGGNNITLSQSTDGASATLTISAGGAGAGYTGGMSNLGNTSGTTGVADRRILFAGGNNVTLSQSLDAANSSATITISAFNQSVQTQNVVDATLAGNTAGVLALISSGTMTLAGGNNVTLSQAGNAVTISAFTQTVQTQNAVDVTLAGNTAGTLALVSSGTLTLAGGNNITLSQAGNAVTVSAFNQTAPVVSNAIQSVSSATNSGTNTSRFAADDHVHAGVGPAGVSTLGNTGGSTAVLHGQLVLVGTNNITLSQSTDASNRMTISISGAGGGGGGSFSAGVSTGGNTSGNTGTVSNQLVLAGINQITLSQSTAAGGATVSISGLPILTASNYQNALGSVVYSGMTEFRTLWLRPFNFQPLGFNLTGSTFLIPLSANYTNTVNSQAHSSTVSVGFYYPTNGTQLTLGFSASSTWELAAATSNSANYHGQRFLTLASSLFDVSPVFSSDKLYYVALHLNTSGTSFANLSVGMWNWWPGAAHSGTFGASNATNTTMGRWPFGDLYSASFTSAMPAALAQSDLSVSTAGPRAFVIQVNQLTGSF